MPLSEKQIKSMNEATAPFNIWVGAISSGKTFAANMKLAQLLKDGPPGDAMIIGVSRQTIQRNVLEDFYRLIGGTPPSSKSMETRLYNRKVWLVGAHDESAVKTIQGSTLAIAYCDEISCIPYPFFKMLEGRLRVPGAIFLGTCNPEGPAHWLKKEFIDQADKVGCKYWNFTLDDNPSLNDAYKTRIKASYTGMWYARYILGEWAAAHGLIYDSFDQLNIYDDIRRNSLSYFVGVDYGTTNATAAVMCGYSRIWPQITVESEYYYDSAKKGRSKTDAELADDLKEFCAYKNITAMYVDPAAASLKLALRRLDMPVVDANNDVLLGIKHTAKFISQKNIAIHRGCSTLIEHIQSYAWDAKAADRGEDKPLKVNDHICFPAGTFIRTPKGRLPIEDVEVGTEVLTRNGVRKVIANGYRSAKTFEYILANKVLIGTKEHPVFTVEKGWKKLEDLIRSDILITIKKDIKCQNMVSQKLLNGTEKNIDDIQMLQEFLRKDISNAEECICIGIFGNPLMEKSQKDIISITSIRTNLTMIYPIWNVFLSSSIQKDIQKIVREAFQTIAGKGLLSGINQIMGKSGIKKGPLFRDLGTGSQHQILANGVKALIRQKKDLKSNFVRISVGQPTGDFLELTMSLENALDVISSLSLINTKKRNIARKAVLQKQTIRKEMVFSLAVDGEREYFANDILVSNCDSLRYAIASKFPSGELSHPDENKTIEQMRRDVYEDFSNPFGIDPSGYR